MAKKKNKIHIKKSKRGTFIKAAKKKGMSTQAFASLVLANKDKYSSAMVKKANFAKNSTKFKHQIGGDINKQQGGKIVRAPRGYHWMKQSSNDYNLMRHEDNFIPHTKASQEVKFPIQKRHQLGGDLTFPNAKSYNQIGTIPNNKINHTPSTMKRNEGRPIMNYRDKGLFQSGGSINISSIDQNQFLHPADSNRLSYKTNPIGTSIMIRNKYQYPALHLPVLKTKNTNRFNIDLGKKGFKAKANYQVNPNLSITGQFKYKTKRGPHGQVGLKYTPNTYQQGGNIASTEQEFKNGLNDGINVFQFPGKGLKKMTMNPESGAIEYPVDYKGYTDGEQTDQGTANPGEDFSVNGDTVVETPNLSEMDFNAAIAYANKNKLPIFRWRENDYPIKKHMKRRKKMQDGGMFSSKVTNKVKLDPGFSPDIQ